MKLNPTLTKEIKRRIELKKQLIHLTEREIVAMQKLLKNAKKETEE